MERNIESLITNTISNLKEILDVGTVVGSPIRINDNVCLLPICKMTMGLISGGCDVGKVKIKKAKIDNYAGGSGTGLTYSPVGIVSIVGDVVKYIPLEDSVPYYNIVNSIEKMISKIFDKNREEK